jgi:hypothetical protein
VEAGRLLDVLKAAAKAELLAVWQSLRSHHRSDVDTFVRTVVPSILGTEYAVGELAYSYMADIYEERGEPFPARLALDRTTGAVIRNGVPPATVYARPFVDVWTGLGDYELDLEEALHRGATRIDELVDTDLSLAHDWTVRDLMGQTRVTGWRRVLVGATNCALCIVASTQRYRTSRLKGIHPGCNCVVRPIFGEDDAPHVLDGDLLEQVHKEIATKFGVSDRAARKIDYRKILLTREHGEYGPTLTYSTDRFTGPDDLVTPGRRYDRP